jgi:diacylglycerol kinase family enzyme
MRVCPQVDPVDGLDLVALKRMRITTVLRVAMQTFTSGRHVRSRSVTYLHGERRMRIDADTPMPVQADGELLGDLTELDVELVPDALSVMT